MACTLTSDFSLGCRDSVGGIKEIYVTALGNTETLSASGGTVYAFTLTQATQFFTYSLEKEDAEWTQNTQYNPETSSKFSEQTLSFTVRKMTLAARNELKLLLQNRVMVIVLDRNGLYWLLGQTNGMDVTTMEGKTGKAMGDMNGWTITLVGKEEDMAQTVNSNLIASLTSPAA